MSRRGKETKAGRRGCSVIVYLENRKKNGIFPVRVLNPLLNSQDIFSVCARVCACVCYRDRGARGGVHAEFDSKWKGGVIVFAATGQAITLV